MCLCQCCQLEMATRIQYESTKEVIEPLPDKFGKMHRASFRRERQKVLFEYLCFKSPWILLFRSSLRPACRGGRISGTTTRTAGGGGWCVAPPSPSTSSRTASTSPTAPSSPRSSPDSMCQKPTQVIVSMLLAAQQEELKRPFPRISSLLRTRQHTVAWRFSWLEKHPQTFHDLVLRSPPKLPTRMKS